MSFSISSPSSVYSDSDADSIFSATSEVSSVASSFEEAPLARPRTHSPSTVHLPLKLPSPPSTLRPVDYSALILDEGLEGVPFDFVLHKLSSMGPSLLHNVSATRIHLPAGPSVPSHILCCPPISPVNTPTPIPTATHILAITGAGSQRRLLVPVHGLTWATQCSNLSIISSSPELQPPHPRIPSVPAPDLDDDAETWVYLPAIEINLPSIETFPLLQTWIHLASPEHLLSALIPKPPSSTTPSSFSALLNPDPSTLANDLSSLHAGTILSSVKLVHGLWQNCVALGLLDEELWKCMGEAWSLLVGALAIKEGNRRAAQDSRRRMQAIASVLV